MLPLAVRPACVTIGERCRKKTKRPALASPLTPLRGSMSSKIHKDLLHFPAASQDRQIDAMMHELMDLSPDAIFFKDGDGRWLWVNGAGVQLFGLEGISYYGLSDQELAHLLGPDSCFTRHHMQSCSGTDEKAWQAGAPWRGEECVLVNGELTRHFDVIKTPLFGPDGARRGLLGIRRDISEQMQAYSKIHYLANYDSLTGLPNRTLFQEQFAQVLATAKAQEQLLAMLFLDLDRFKDINEAHGHGFGDTLLQSVTKRIKGCIRASDMLARLGGDEFALIQVNPSHVDDAERLAQRLIQAFSRPFNIHGHEIHSTVSIGITRYPFDGQDVQQLLQNADIAMYRAKREGRNQSRIYTADMSTQTQARVALEKNLRRALAKREFLLHYQPQVDLQTGQIVGMEALLRWQRPGFGIVPPAEFIPVAEESGLIIPIGEWVLREACTQNKLWQDAGLPSLRMAVNISARQFGLNGRFMTEMVDQVLKESGLMPEYLELELTESLVMANPEQTAHILHRLKDRGISISVDDFGTGYSSLSYLKRFPIDKLKIDRSFVRDITHDDADAAIVNAVISLGHSLNLQVIAEGVETTEQLEYLRQEGCDGIQGYLFSRPMPAIALTQMLRKVRPFEINSSK